MRPPRPPQFKPARLKQTVSLTGDTRAPWIFLSALAIVQCGPVLDRVFSPVLNSDLFAAQPTRVMAYEFIVEPTGWIRSRCVEGASRIELLPGESLKTSDGAFSQVILRASLCTEFGFKKRDVTFYIPTDLLTADSDVVKGIWETKTYTGVPSVNQPDRTMTIQVRKTASDQLEIASVPDGLEQPEFQPVRVTLNPPEEMSTIKNWRSDLLPLREIHFQLDTPFLSRPFVLDGKLLKIRPASRI